MNLELNWDSVFFLAVSISCVWARPSGLVCSNNHLQADLLICCQQIPVVYLQCVCVLTSWLGVSTLIYCGWISSNIGALLPFKDWPFSWDGLGVRGVCAYVRVWLCVCVCMYVCTLCMCVCVCVCTLCMCVHVCIYVKFYVCIRQVCVVFNWFKLDSPAVEVEWWSAHLCLVLQAPPTHTPLLAWQKQRRIWWYNRTLCMDALCTGQHIWPD